MIEPSSSDRRTRSRFGEGQECRPSDGRDLRLVDATEQLERNEIDPTELKPIIDGIAAGDLAKGIELTSPELAERLPVSGSPTECAAKIRAEIAPAGVNHMILAITDRSLVKAFPGMDIDGGRRREHAAAADPRRGDPCGLRVSPARIRARRRVSPAV